MLRGPLCRAAPRRPSARPEEPAAQPGRTTGRTLADAIAIKVTTGAWIGLCFALYKLFGVAKDQLALRMLFRLVGGLGLVWLVLLRVGRYDRAQLGLAPVAA